jgi:Ser/Thr protein kinase RdoA (MazF antagonist)
MTIALAPDPIFPYRDALLDPQYVASLLASRLEWATGIVRAERVRATYRIGTSLRIRHRFEAGGRIYEVAARAFRPGRSLHAFENAVAPQPCRDGCAPGVVHAPEIETVFWLFPNDRRVPALQAIEEARASLSRHLPRPWTHSRLVAWAPENSATFQCRDGNGEVLAYAKVGPSARNEYSRYRTLADALRRSGSPLLVPHAIAFCRAHDTLLLEAVPGRKLVYTPGDLRAMGIALACLHAQNVPDLPAFRRFSAASRREAVDLLTLALPRLARAVARLDGVLARVQPAAADAAGSLHGDVHPRNVVVNDTAVTLIDVEEMSSGSRAADLGSLLSRLCAARVLGDATPADVALAAAAFLDGYASAARLPGDRSIKWHTAAALLVERAQRAVVRCNAPLLQRVDALVDEAARLLDSTAVV